jgi:hypothetical protein
LPTGIERNKNGYKKMTKSVLTTFLFVLVCTISLPLASQPKPRVLTPGNKQFTYRNYQLPGPRIEMGLSGGVVFPFTDVAPGAPDQQPGFLDFRFETVDINAGLIFRYRFNDLYAIRGAANYLKLKGDDRWAQTDTVRQRNRSFTNELYEMSVMGEFYIPKRKHNVVKNSWIDFVLYAGVGAIYHDPLIEGIIIGPDGKPDAYDLEQRTDPFAYKNIAMVFPTGVQVQYNYLNKWTVGLDMNFRWTFTDFLDGFDRPAVQRPDYYFTTNLNFTYVLTYAPRKANVPLFRGVFKKKRSNAGNQGWM